MVPGRLCDAIPSKLVWPCWWYGELNVYLFCRLDGKHVVFGKVNGQSLPLLKKIEAYGSKDGKTSVPIVITDCGQLWTVNRRHFQDSKWRVVNYSVFINKGIIFRFPFDWLKICSDIFYPQHLDLVCRYSYFLNKCPEILIKIRPKISETVVLPDQWRNEQCRKLTKIEHDTRY